MLNNPVNFIDEWGNEVANSAWGTTDGGGAFRLGHIEQGTMGGVQISNADARAFLETLSQLQQANPNGTAKQPVIKQKTAGVKEEANNPTVTLNKPKGNEGKDKEEDEVVEEVQDKEKGNGIISRIRKIRVNGKTEEVWHEMLDALGRVIHRDWKGPGQTPPNKPYTR